MWRDELEARVLEVKCIEGLGTTVDAVLLNGTLRVTDTLVLCGMHGAIVTPVRALLTPEPLKELRVKVSFFVLICTADILYFTNPAHNNLI